MLMFTSPDGLSHAVSFCIQSLFKAMLTFPGYSFILMPLACRDGRHLQHVGRPLVAGCSTGHKPLPPSMLANGTWAKLKTQMVFRRFIYFVIIYFFVLFFHFLML